MGSSAHFSTFDRHLRRPVTRATERTSFDRREIRTTMFLSPSKSITHRPHPSQQKMVVLFTLLCVSHSRWSSRCCREHRLEVCGGVPHPPRRGHGERGRDVVQPEVVREGLALGRRGSKRAHRDQASKLGVLIFCGHGEEELAAGRQGLHGHNRGGAGRRGVDGDVEDGGGKRESSGRLGFGGSGRSQSIP